MTIHQIIAILWIPLFIILIHIYYRFFSRKYLIEPLYTRISKIRMALEVLFCLIGPVIIMLGGFFTVVIDQKSIMGLSFLLAPMFFLVNYKAVLNFYSVEIFEDHIRINDVKILLPDIEDITLRRFPMTGTIKLKGEMPGLPRSIVIWTATNMFAHNDQDKLMLAWKRQKNHN